jgi:hypothetical protein
MKYLIRELDNNFGTGEGQYCKTKLEPFPYKCSQRSEFLHIGRILFFCTVDFYFHNTKKCISILSAQTFLNFM